MLLRTHYIFSIGLLALVDSILSHEYFYYILIVAGIVSVIANTLIDRIGHKEIITRYGYIPVRTPLTHTWFRSIVWGLLSITPIIALLAFYDYESHNFIYDTSLLFIIVIDGLIVGPSHMLLDVFTERGIYVKKKGRWARYALAHFKYNNPGVNGLAILAGIIMLLYSARII
ncbi:DUF1286 domain-containing protein [Sulfolobus tengchongensis]|uniref:DUF1286 domain-containing protein n=1 Tax=Sulfolobus tengchongensis TaxID=207809 RepID=A0AAX4KYG0_9CREN